MRVIELTQDKVALVDDGDYGWLMEFKWCAHFNGTKWYAVSRINARVIKMHRLIMDSEAAYINGRHALLEVDHQDGDSLNNQRYNLRWVTRAQNLRNRVANKNSTSQYIGVYFENYTQRWCAAIKIDGKTYKLGRFDSEHDAAVKRDIVAFDMWGDDARLNVLEIK